MSEPSESELQDKELTCKDCGQQFAHTVRDQIFFQEKGFEHEPTRCLPCRRVKKDRINGGLVVKQ